MTERLKMTFKEKPNFHWLVYVLALTAGLLACKSFSLTQTPDNGLACLPPPESFREADLVGVWVANYFEDIDKLLIRSDGTYKQIFSSESITFESDWQKWWIEYKPEGYALVHLTGMRRCDDLNLICNTTGGGLPLGEEARDPCTEKRITYAGEVLLFVTGYPDNVPRGIVLRHARLVGSDWEFGFKFQEPIEP
jgi:hypothetical protein